MAWMISELAIHDGNLIKWEDLINLSQLITGVSAENSGKWIQYP